MELTPKLHHRILLAGAGATVKNTAPKAISARRVFTGTVEFNAT